jgi:hypothetical protein
MVGPKVNLEYMLLLRQVVTCLIRGLSDPRLQPPSAEEIVGWLRSVEPQDVENLLSEAKRLALVANCPAQCGGSDITPVFQNIAITKMSSDA